MTSPLAVTHTWCSMEMESLVSMSDRSYTNIVLVSLSHTKNKIHCLIKCAIFSYAVSGIDVSEDALRGMKFGPCSVGESYSLASTYEYTKRESVWLNFLICFM